MYNVIHRKTFRMDQYSTELMVNGDNIFKIPVPRVGGGFKWKGCYCTPCTALTALKAYSDEMKLSEGKHNELVDRFQATLFRTDKGKITENLHITPAAAPVYTKLKSYGGTLTVEEYRKLYDQNHIMGDIFVQKIPEESTDVKDLDLEEDTLADPNRSLGVDWHHTIIPVVSKCTKDYLEGLVGTKDKVPRNLSNAISYLQCYGSLDSGDHPRDNFVVYVHPEKKNCFAVGTVNGLVNQKYNKLGSKLLSSKDQKAAVFGDVVMVTKNKPVVLSKRKQTKKEKKIPLEEEEDSSEKDQAEKEKVEFNQDEEESQKPDSTTTTTTTLKATKAPTKRPAVITVKKIKIPAPKKQKVEEGKQLETVDALPYPENFDNPILVINK